MWEVLVMPRLSRLDAPGVLHHVIGRGIERRKIFLDALDHNDFVLSSSTAPLLPLLLQNLAEKFDTISCIV
jgi:hypothetical protein